MSEEYVCCQCLGIFKKCRTDEEARDEFKENFGIEFSPDDPQVCIVCDKCYQAMRKDHPDLLGTH